jgi:hypothetical protein
VEKEKEEDDRDVKKQLDGEVEGVGGEKKNKHRKEKGGRTSYHPPIFAFRSG